MPKGGRRPGAGRPKGSKHQKTLSRALAAVEGADITPVEFMLQELKTCIAEGDRKGAREMAVAAAPYTHPRLAAVAYQERKAVDLLDPDKLTKLVRIAELLLPKLAPETPALPAPAAEAAVEADAYD